MHMHRLNVIQHKRLAVLTCQCAFALSLSEQLLLQLLVGHNVTRDTASQLTCNYLIHSFRVGLQCFDWVHVPQHL